MRPLEEFMLDPNFMYLCKIGKLNVGKAPRLPNGCRLRQGMMCYAYPITVGYWRIPLYDITIKNSLIFSFTQTERHSPIWERVHGYDRSGSKIRTFQTKTAVVGKSDEVEETDCDF